MQRDYQQQLVLAFITVSTSMLQQIADIYTSFEDPDVKRTSKDVVKALGDYNEAVRQYALRERLL